MSTLYIGFCVMKCAFIAMFVSVCKTVNPFFSWSDFFPLVCNQEHWFYIQFTLCDFSSSFQHKDQCTEAHKGSSVWLSAFCNPQFVNFIGLLQPGDWQSSPALSPAQTSLSQLGHSALNLWKVEINGHPNHGLFRPAPRYCVYI